MGSGQANLLKLIEKGLNDGQKGALKVLFQGQKKGFKPGSQVGCIPCTTDNIDNGNKT